MNHIELFNFVDAIPKPAGADYVAEIPVGLTSAEALLQAVYDGLQLPGYFGFNWNALSDCLRDLHWLQHDVVVLRHVELPGLPDVQLRIYLEVLADAVNSWQPDEEHSLRVEFPTSTRESVTRLLTLSD